MESVKKRLLAIMAACLLALPAAACGDSADSAGSTGETVAETDAEAGESEGNTDPGVLPGACHDMSFEYPADAEYSADGNDVVSIGFGDTATIIIQAVDISPGQDSAETYRGPALASAISAYDTSDVEYAVTAVGGQEADTAFGNACVSDSILSMNWISVSDPDGAHIYTITYAETTDSTDADTDRYEYFLDSVSFE